MPKAISSKATGFFVDRYDEEVSNVIHSNYDTDLEWSLDFDMTAITNNLNKILRTLMIDFVNSEILSKERSYPGLNGGRMLHRIAEDDFRALCDSKEFKDVPPRYKRFLTTMSKKMIILTMYSMFHKFEDRDDT